MSIIFSALITFVCLWILVALFDHRIDEKMKRIVLLTIIITVVSAIGKAVGMVGILIAAIVNVIAIMKLLGYDFLTAFLFSMGLQVLQYFIIVGLFLK